MTASITTYHISVATHLSPDWCAAIGLAALVLDYDASGRAITRLWVQLPERSALIHVLTELHAANVAILAVDLALMPARSHK